MLTPEAVTMGTVIRMAQEAGWKPKYKRRSTTDVLRQKGRLKLIPWSNLSSLPKREYLVKGFLDSAAMSLAFGESNCGKTFFVLDIGIHISLGKPWRGMNTKQGAVAYIAAEGGMGLEERLKAFRIHHKMEGYAPFYLIPAGVDLCNSEEDAEELISEIQKIENVQLIVVDTLSRAMSGGNENSPDDMGAFIKNCDRMREATKAHVMIIHHSGKNAAQGARGHSALRAAVDTEIEIKKDTATIIADVTKQRDGRTGDKMAFTLTPLSIGRDDEGELRDSCVLVPTVAPLKPEKKLSRQKQKALDILERLLSEKGENRSLKAGAQEVRCVLGTDFSAALKEAALTTSDKPDNVRRRITQIIEDLNKEGITRISGGFIWIPDRSDKSDG